MEDLQRATYDEVEVKFLDAAFRGTPLDEFIRTLSTYAFSIAVSNV